jgi:hypothetical protein
MSPGCLGPAVCSRGHSNADATMHFAVRHRKSASRQRLSVTADASVGTNPRFVDAVNVRSILNSNQFQIVRRKDFPFRVLHFQSAHGFSGAFVQNLKTFLAAGEEMTFSPLAQSNDDREQLSAFFG